MKRGIVRPRKVVVRELFLACTYVWDWRPTVAKRFLGPRGNR